MGCDRAAAANEKFHDFLLQLCAEGAQVLVDTPALEGKGFEAWRLLTKRIAPTGGQYELDAMIALINRKPGKDTAALPEAISRFERDIEMYQRRTGKAFPEEWKTPALLQLLPKAQAESLKLRYAEGLTDYRQIVQNLLTFSQTVRFEGAYGRGDSDMDIGSMDWDRLSPEQLQSFLEAQIAGMNGEDPVPPPPEVEDTFLDALQRKGKGNGKGMRGKGAMSKAYNAGKGGQTASPTGARQPNPATAPPAPGQKDTRQCHWCLGYGHVIATCPARKAGKPKATRPASSLEPEQDWVEDRPAGSLECRSLGGMTRDCNVLTTEDWNLDAAEMMGWIEEEEEEEGGWPVPRPAAMPATTVERTLPDLDPLSQKIIIKNGGKGEKGQNDPWAVGQDPWKGSGKGRNSEWGRPPTATTSIMSSGAITLLTSGSASFQRCRRP